MPELNTNVIKKLEELKTRAQGLTQEEVNQRKNPKPQKKSEYFNNLKIFYRNFNSPIVILLLVVALFSLSIGDIFNVYIVFTIVFTSGLISFYQEYKAHKTTKDLIDSMKMTQTVFRDGEKLLVNADELVTGDILSIDAGDLIPVSCQLIDCHDVFVNESSITGESLPTEKSLEHDPYLKMGSCVVSGIGKAVVLPQDTHDSYSELLNYISNNAQPSSFSQGLLKFSKFLMKATVIFTLSILILLIVFKTPPLQAILFSLSIAVGLSPQLLPAILTTNLAIGAKKMANAGALTKKLESIENFGNMDILCCDKTGTLTKGLIEMYAALDSEGIKSEEIRKLSFINALLQTGFKNSLDQAIITANHFDHTQFEKLDEIPYDFNRKILSILAKFDQKNTLIAKGALENLVDRCSLSEEQKEPLFQRARTYYDQGFRLLGIATKTLDKDKLVHSDEKEMEFKGFLLFFDPIKEDCKEVLAQIKKLGIRLVMITGDHPVVATFVAKESGFTRYESLEGANLGALSPEHLEQSLQECDVFSRVAPIDKAKIIQAYRKMGYTVGYLGDGINDSGALFASDVGISVESGSDMAKATADFILVKKNLSILVQAVQEGRKIFNNTLKYIFMAISANFGNMFSMAGVALFIPFLPLLPTQILLINFLQDFPEMSIAVDNVEAYAIQKPQKWNMNLIKWFMIVFGPISSIFDFATFGVMKYFMATPELFRSAWFTESVISATFIILFIRTRLPFYKSKPSWTLSIFIFGIIVLTLLLPYTPLGPLFSIMVLPAKYYVAIFAIVITYALLVEVTKRIFYRWMLKKNWIS